MWAMRRCFRILLENENEILHELYTWSLIMVMEEAGHWIFVK